MNNLKKLRSPELVRSSVALKRKLYRRDEAAATSPEGQTLPLSWCTWTGLRALRSGRRSTGPPCAQVRAGTSPARTGGTLRASWPRGFATRPAPGAPSAECVMHLNGVQAR